VVFDLEPAPVEALARQGALAARSAREVAQRAGVVYSCLPTEQAAREVLLGPEGAVSGASADSGFVECSTVSPETAVALAAGARAAGAMAVDASVSGSTIPAEHGELVLLVGGDQELYEHCESLFAALAKQTHYMGPSGTGAMTKLVVNTLLGVNMQAIAEAIALGVASGLDRNPLLDVLASNPTVGQAHRPKIENSTRGSSP
jgi:3-hydroxyisobutyrate dehydrogenase-like beta-hydroxyacid dehydrogenase